MQFYIDTANVEEIKKYIDYGLIDGVTTNPALFANENKSVKTVISEICEITHGPVSIEVLSLDVEGMIREARILSKIHENIVVKIPAIPNGFKALHTLSQENIKTNLTMIYTANQALVGAKLGATYVSPFVGRLDATSTNGTELIKEIVRIYSNYDFSTKILAASMRNVIYVKEAALAGAHIATIPPEVLEQLMISELTELSLKGFLEKWGNLSKEKRDFLGTPNT